MGSGRRHASAPRHALGRASELDAPPVELSLSLDCVYLSAARPRLRVGSTGPVAMGISFFLSANNRHRAATSTQDFAEERS